MDERQDARAAGHVGVGAQDLVEGELVPAVDRPAGIPEGDLVERGGVALGGQGLQLPELGGGGGGIGRGRQAQLAAGAEQEGRPAAGAGLDLAGRCRARRRWWLPHSASSSASSSTARRWSRVRMRRRGGTGTWIRISVFLSHKLIGTAIRADYGGHVSLNQVDMHVPSSVPSPAAWSALERCEGAAYRPCGDQAGMGITWDGAARTAAVPQLRAAIA